MLRGRFRRVMNDKVDSFVENGYENNIIQDVDYYKSRKEKIFFNSRRMSSVQGPSAIHHRTLDEKWTWYLRYSTLVFDGT